MAQENSIGCFECHAALPVRIFQPGVRVKCPHCDNPVQGEFFPAFYRKPAPVQVGELLLDDDEASCFYHPQKKAAVACEGCGRFLCPLCEVEFSGRHLCPVCIESGKSKKKIRDLETERVMYDDIALSLVVIPAVFFFLIYLTLFTAPVALYYVIRYWNAPRSVVPRTRLRFVFALGFSLAEILGWVALAFSLYSSWRRYH